LYSFLSVAIRIKAFGPLRILPIALALRIDEFVPGTFALRDRTARWLEGPPAQVAGRASGQDHPQQIRMTHTANAAVSTTIQMLYPK
jgi:hypothetical protein